MFREFSIIVFFLFVCYANAQSVVHNAKLDNKEVRCLGKFLKFSE